MTCSRDEANALDRLLSARSYQPAAVRHDALTGSSNIQHFDHRILHTAARLARGGRRRRLKIPDTWLWAEQITTA